MQPGVSSSAPTAADTELTQKNCDELRITKEMEELPLLEMKRQQNVNHVMSQMMQHVKQQ